MQQKINEEEKLKAKLKLKIIAKLGIGQKREMAELANIRLQEFQQKHRLKLETEQTEESMKFIKSLTN